MKRFSYFLIFCSLMAVEVCIALFVHDSFIRPYVGDMLVTLLADAALGVLLYFAAVLLLPHIHSKESSKE